MHTLTQVEKAFIVNFLSNTFANLTQNNTDSLVEALEPAEADYYADSYFIRLQDATEVLEHLMCCTQQQSRSLHVLRLQYSKLLLQY